MGILELPGVHMHWADRWGFRSKVSQQPEIAESVILELAEGSTITVLNAPNVLPFDDTPAYGIYDVEVEPEPEPKPWFIFRCGVCKQDIPFYLTVDMATVNPFQATVIATQCEQCASRWAAILPPVRVVEADKLSLQETDMIDGSTH